MPYRVCIATVDAGRARLYTFELSALGEGLILHCDLKNPLGRTHAVSPAKERLDAAFARVIGSELEALLRRSGATKLIVCAAPRMLMELRAVRAAFRQGALVLDELPRDVGDLTPPELRELLVAEGMLPSMALGTATA